MLTKKQRISYLKNKLSKSVYINMIEAHYGIDTCNEKYSEEMYLDDKLSIELLEGDYDCSSIKIVKSLIFGEQVIKPIPLGLRFNFLIASTVWTIDNLDAKGFIYNPSVTILDIDNNVIDANVTYPEYAKKIVITFNNPTIGYVDIS